MTSENNPPKELNRQACLELLKRAKNDRNVFYDILKHETQHEFPLDKINNIVRDLEHTQKNTAKAPEN